MKSYYIDWSNKEEVLNAVKQDGMDLELAKEELQADKEVVIEAVSSNSDSFGYASYELQSDRDVIIAALNKDARTLLLLDDRFMEDKELVLIAIKQDSYLFKYAGDKLRSDKYFVLEAMKHKASIHFASARLIEDVVAVKHHSYISSDIEALRIAIAEDERKALEKELPAEIIKKKTEKRL